MSMETAVGADGAGYPPKHSTGAAGATTENGVHLCREYDKVASEASVGGQSIAGPSAGEDGHGSTSHSAGHQKEEGGDKKHRRAISEQEPDDVETEERAPPERLHAPNASGHRGGGGGGVTPTQKRVPMERSEGLGEDP